MKEMVIEKLQYESYLSNYSPKPLVVPPAGRGYSSTTNRELNQHYSRIKLKTKSITSFHKSLSYTTK
jgi:hypothetical protein